MSLDQSVNVQNNHHQHDDTQPVCNNSFDTSYLTPTFTNILNTDTEKENESFKNCRTEHSQCSKRGDVSLDGVECLQNENNNPSLVVSECNKLQPNRHIELTEIELDKSKQFSDSVDSGEKFPHHFDADDILFGDRGIQESFDASKEKNGRASEIFPPYLDSETTRTEQNHSDVTNLQIKNDVESRIGETDSLRDENEIIARPDSKSPVIQNNDMWKDIYTGDDRNPTTPIQSELINEQSISDKPNHNHESRSFGDTIETNGAGDDDDGEMEKNTDISNDENETLSNEDEFAEDTGEYHSVDVVDFDGTNEVENDEYILDTFVKKPRRERRRIVSVNDDDSDPEMEVEREKLLKSTSPLLDNNVMDDKQDVEEEVDIELLIQNEKPGPKSKKMSTQILKELQARALLRNAVVIPSSGGKKKKSRIIDSDDDEESKTLFTYRVDVDDIGLPDLSMENDDEGDEIASNSILMNDIDKIDKSPIENSIVFLPPKQEQVLGVNSSCAIPSYENQTQDIFSTEVKCKTENVSPIKYQHNVSSESNDVLHHVKMEPTEIVKQEPSYPIIIMETPAIRDSGSTEVINQQLSVEDDFEIADVHFPPFSTSSSSENEEEFIPNDVYFGTPDSGTKKSSRGKGRPRGRPVQSMSQQATIAHNGIRKAERARGTGRRGRPSKGNQFIDNRRMSSTSGSVSTSSSNETDDEYQKSKARRKPQTITIVKTPSKLYHNVSLPTPPIQQQRIQQQQVQKSQIKQQRIQRQRIQQQHHQKNDRFYDKSQDIPNSIYFGDVDVPLHVLHAYGDSDSDTGIKPEAEAEVIFDPLKYIRDSIKFPSQVVRGRVQTHHSPLGQQRYQTHNQRLTPISANSHKTRGRPKINSVSPSNDRSIQMMKKYFKAAGLKKVKLNRLWEGCKSNSERAAKMLDLLHEKGLEGEPTISKCKQLKVEDLAKKEIEDLDPNLIIQTEGRTRRSVTRAATKRQYTYDEDEILETRTKLRKVIDSDSDFE